jgi:hypothetical protein
VSREPITAITDEVIDTYRHGLCYDLALALRERTGLPLAVLVLTSELPGREPSLMHAALAVEGGLLDVAGPASLDDTLTYYQTYEDGIGLDQSLTWHMVHTDAELAELERQLFGEPDEPGMGDPYEARYRQRAGELAELVLQRWPVSAAA